jgi:hypothetical protein
VAQGESVLLEAQWTRLAGTLAPPRKVIALQDFIAAARWHLPSLKNVFQFLGGSRDEAVKQNRKMQHEPEREREMVELRRRVCAHVHGASAVFDEQPEGRHLRIRQSSRVDRRKGIF